VHARSDLTKEGDLSVHSLCIPDAILCDVIILLLSIRFAFNCGLSVCQSVCLSVCQSVSLSVCLSVSQSVCRISSLSLTLTVQRDARHGFSVYSLVIYRSLFLQVSISGHAGIHLFGSQVFVEHCFLGDFNIFIYFSVVTKESFDNF